MYVHSIIIYTSDILSLCIPICIIDSLFRTVQGIIIFAHVKFFTVNSAVFAVCYVHWVGCLCKHLVMVMWWIAACVPELVSKLNRLLVVSKRLCTSVVISVHLMTMTCSSAAAGKNSSIYVNRKQTFRRRRWTINIRCVCIHLN